MEALYALIVSYAGKVVLALVVLLVGVWVISRITNLITDRLHKAALEDSLRSFLIPLIRIILQVLLVITIASMLGAEMTSFIAIIGAAGFAIG